MVISHHQDRRQRQRSRSHDRVHPYCTSTTNAADTSCHTRHLYTTDDESAAMEPQGRKSDRSSYSHLEKKDHKGSSGRRQRSRSRSEAAVYMYLGQRCTSPRIQTKADGVPQNEPGASSNRQPDQFQCYLASQDENKVLTSIGQYYFDQFKKNIDQYLL